MDFCELCHLVTFNDVALKDIFWHGLNEPIRCCLPGGKIHWSLEQYIDFALRLDGGPFTVGLADEEHCFPSVSAKPGKFSIMSGIIQVTSEPFHAMPAAPGPAHAMPALPESAPVVAVREMAAIPKPVHKMAATPEPHQSKIITSKSHLAMSATPKANQVMADPLVSSQGCTFSAKS
ncbi:hypothetical protein M9458_046961, partial [Cirrhinus mrigala]